MTDPYAGDRHLDGSKALLSEIIRRAAYDWALYHEESDPARRKLADEAGEWLFDERPGHPVWEERKHNGDMSMSFLSICQSLGLEPESIRQGIRDLTPHRIRNLGTLPRTRSTKPGQYESGYDSAAEVSRIPKLMLVSEEYNDWGIHDE